MALDEWLLEQHRTGQGPPTLRFYRWAVPTLSLGYHQRHWPQRWHDLVWGDRPVELVRRPSGGRAVLHQGDLTYALVTSGLPGSRTQVYHQLCQFLIAGWNALGVELHYGQAGRGYIHNPNCFGTATAADLVTADGSKLIGSAQLRRGSALLQHGSMRLTPDAALFEQVFDTPLQLSESWRSTVAAIAPDDLIHALQTAACEQFGITLVAQPLTAQEWEAVCDRASRWTVAQPIDTPQD